jgi:hypothetical protein
MWLMEAVHSARVTKQVYTSPQHKYEYTLTLAALWYLVRCRSGELEMRLG